MHFLQLPLMSVRPLWATVRKELRDARTLLPVAFVELAWRVHPVAFAQDAQGAS